MCQVKQSPGKFEGQTCVTHYAHAVAMSGMADDIDVDESDVATSLIVGPFDIFTLRDELQDFGLAMCDDCKAALYESDSVEYWEDSQGFAYSTFR